MKITQKEYWSQSFSHFRSQKSWQNSVNIISFEEYKNFDFGSDIGTEETLKQEKTKRYYDLQFRVNGKKLARERILR